MKKIIFIFLTFSLSLSEVTKNVNNCLDLTEDSGYVDVRPGAHMFWVTYHTELDGDWSNHPLIMWLQGGPGSSSVGYGNFWLLGPCDIHGKPRNSRWTQKANMMFVDNPVGTGYSYVDSLSDLTTTNAQIAEDLVTLLINVFQEYPDKQKMPFFIYSESYGGKMAIDFALLLLQSIDSGAINCNFQGVVMGDSWISPIDYVNTWGPFLYELGFVNEAELKTIERSASRTQNAVDAGLWKLATNLWMATEMVIINVTGGIDFYNVHAKDSSIYSPQADITHQQNSNQFKNLPIPIGDIIQRQIASRSGDPLDLFMNGDEQKQKWNIPEDVIWGGQSANVFNTLNEDFMKPVIDSVAEAINLYRIHVAVYTGNLDLICDTPGTYLWINNMDYSGKAEFDNTDRINMNVPEYPNLSWYYQRQGVFSVNTFLRAGHMMPLDTPSGALDLVDLVTAWGAEANSAYKARNAAEQKLAARHQKVFLTKHNKKVQEVVPPQLERETIVEYPHKPEVLKHHPIPIQMEGHQEDETTNPLKHVHTNIIANEPIPLSSLSQAEGKPNGPAVKALEGKIPKLMESEPVVEVNHKEAEIVKNNDKSLETEVHPKEIKESKPLKEVNPDNHQNIARNLRNYVRSRMPSTKA